MKKVNENVLMMFKEEIFESDKELQNYEKDNEISKIGNIYKIHENGEWQFVLIINHDLRKLSNGNKLNKELKELLESDDKK